MPKDIIPIRITGGMNNRYTPVSLFMRDRGEVVRLINADLSIMGEIRPLRPLAAVNATAVEAIHSLVMANDILLAGHYDKLSWLNGTALTQIHSGLSGSRISFGHAGNWVYMADGTNKKATYLPTKAASDWGHAIPSAGPTIQAGAAGNPNGTYSCYYRYRITLPDGSIILTALSAVASVITVSSQKILWSDLVHASFTGATSVQIDLFRTKVGFAATYFVATIDSTDTSYEDDLSDASLQAEVEYAEGGYWPPPDNPEIAVYHNTSDRVFIAVGNSVYWTEAGKYHIVHFDEVTGLYDNMNDVFLAGENITAIVVLDENVYVASKKTWTRLRGRDPGQWIWEPTSAECGPVSWRSCVVTRWGVIYAGNDGRIWLFNGFRSVPFFENFVFPTTPGVECHGTFDGRFYRLFYEDTAYPEIVVDFLDYPATPPRPVQSARSAISSWYEKGFGLYIGGADGYVRNGEDVTQEVAILIETPEVPVEDLATLGDMGKLVIRADTAGANLVITPKQDGVEQDALTPIVTNSLRTDSASVALGQYMVQSFILEITSAGAVRIMDPLILTKDDGRSV